MNTRHPKRLYTAFTLVELLVVIGIIAMLISILLPTLGKAREMARSAKCLSNLKQMSMALIMYANDNKGCLPPTNPGYMKFPIDGVTYNVFTSWFAGAYRPGVPTATNVNRGSDTYYAPGSPLHKYWGGVPNVLSCPSFASVETMIRPGYGPVSYAYNGLAGHHYPTPPMMPGITLNTTVGEKLSKIKGAPNKAAFWDSARIEPAGTLLDRTPWGYPTSGKPDPAKYFADPNFHARHGNRGNVAWFDGHCSSFAPAYFDDYGSTTETAPPALLRKSHIGNIDSDGNRMTDEHYVLY